MTQKSNPKPKTQKSNPNMSELVGLFGLACLAYQINPSTTDDGCAFLQNNHQTKMNKNAPNAVFRGLSLWTGVDGLL